jgi:hypothetical protein
MYKIVFVFVLGVATGYMVAGLSEAEVAPQREGVGEEQNAVTESVTERTTDAPWNEEEREVQTQTLIDERIGVRLSYRTEPHGYLARALAPTANDDANFIKGYSFTLKDDIDTVRGQEPTEGPATIDIRTYKNPDRLAPSVWASANPMLSNVALARSDSEEVVVGGANGVRYLVDGLYLIDTVVVAHANMIYVITGAYMDEFDATFVDFDPLLSSIEFIPVQ